MNATRIKGLWANYNGYIFKSYFYSKWKLKCTDSNRLNMVIKLKQKRR